VVAVNVGNPHCVLFFDEALDDLPWRQWGAALECHPRFPHRTNVQFARIVDRGTVEIRIWERGAGETSASGSSSTAVVAAALASGRIDPGEISVRMPGGELQVSAHSGRSLLLRGPVEVIGRIHLHPSWLKRRLNQD
jgi:diaminopimelate epimerase